MPFIGQEPITGAFHKLDAITTSSTNTYNLLMNGSAYSPASANNLMVSLNGVIQSPGSSFTISGSQITFVPSSGTLSSSDNIDFIMAYGDVLNIGTPSDGSVNTSQLATDAVTQQKIADGAVNVARLSDTLNLTGKTVTLNKNASSLVHLKRIDNSASASAIGFPTLFTDNGEFEHYELYIERILGSSSSGGENLDVKFYVGPVGSATLDNGSSTAYTVDNMNLGTGVHRNVNGTDNMELFTTNTPNKGWQGKLICTNFGPRQDGGYPNMISTLSADTVSFTSSNTYYNSRNHQVTGIRFAFTAGNVTAIKMDLYGVKT